MTKLAVVFGGTGAQGGSVIKTFLKEPGWKIRTVTRDPSKPASKELEKQGVQVVKGDLNDLDSLVAAVQGANLVYGVTDFWGLLENQEVRAHKPEGKIMCNHVGDVEEELGKNIAKAVATIADTTLELYVWSSLANTIESSKGKYLYMFHWDSKAHVYDYIKKELPTLAAKTSTLQVGLYLDSLRAYQFFKKAPGEDVYELVFPGIGDVLVPWVHTREDNGKFVKALWNAGPGKTLVGASEMMSIHDFVTLWGKINNVPTRWKNPSLVEMQQAWPEELAQEVWESGMFVAEFGWAGGDPDTLWPEDLGIESLTKVADYIATEYPLPDTK